MTQRTLPELVELHRELTVPDWPNGRFRTVAEFKVEGNVGRERVARRTQKREGGWASPRRTVYFQKARIAKDSEGKTWVLSLSGYGAMCLTPGTLTTCLYVHEREPGYQALRDQLLAAE